MEKEIVNRLLSDVEKEIIKNMWDCNLCVQEIAKRMCYNRSGIYYHINKIRNLTGLDPKKVRDLANLREMV